MVSRLQHNNIVTVYDMGIDNHRPYLVLEYIQGTSLQDKIRNGLSVDESLRIMRDMLAGVAAAHAQKIAHGDIKPTNTLINESGNAKVADFGLAHFSEALQDEDTGLYSTLLYMAPEYIETRQHQIVSDVFSLGLVFHEMFTGKPAVDGDDIYQILNRISNEIIEAPSKTKGAIDERLDDFILKSLTKNPQQRYADAGIMLQAFNDYLSLNDQEPSGDNHDATVSFLLRRMRHKSDFPVFSQTISVLNKVSSSDTDSEAFLCALLQKLGKALTRLYLHDESQAIDKLVSLEGLTEVSATAKILGTSYHKLGISVAREWGFPEQIIDSMKPLDLSTLNNPPTSSAKLQIISQFSNALGALLKLPTNQQSAAIKNLCASYSRVLKLDDKKIDSMLDNCLKELVEFARLIQFNLKDSAYYQ